MSNETLFYVFGIALAVSAVLTSFIGLKMKDFPGKAFPVVVLWFAILVGGATTFAVLHAKDEQSEKSAEFKQAGKEIEKEQTSGPYGAEGAQGNEEGSSEGGELDEEPGSGIEQDAEPAEGTGSATGGSKGPGATLKLAASPTELAYDKTELSAKPGKVTIDFDNPAPIEHNVVIEKDGKEVAGTELIAEGKTTVSAELAPGTYTFLCTVPGHAEAGMEGTLTVK